MGLFGGRPGPSHLGEGKPPLARDQPGQHPQRGEGSFLACSCRRGPLGAWSLQVLSAGLPPAG